ncbi:LemA family protein [Deinococcus arcticus]|uniref:LemA family protein n=1 Tax=Deinococcus arcticus TaxID=2136176 RepID=A0A2T3WCW3_9DEIO|nr:LemA family protein [Deinococcus arcticus]PTA69746.1 hypothetical protein C8263_01655 [Deinococcus arcticus]
MTLLSWAALVLGGVLGVLWLLGMWSHHVSEDDPNDALNPVWGSLLLGVPALLLVRSGLGRLEAGVPELLWPAAWVLGLGLATLSTVQAARAALVRPHEALQAARLKLDAAHKARAELIPNLVQVVRSFTRTEEETIGRVLAAQKAAEQGTAAPGEVTASVQLLMRRLYEFPQLQSAPMYRQLMASLQTAQSDIFHYTAEYNTLAARFNTLVRTFPMSTVARRTGLQAAPYAEAALSPEERSAQNLLTQLP